VDAYLSKLIPPLATAKPGALRVFLPGVHSRSLDKTGTLGFHSVDGNLGEMACDEHELVMRTNFLRDRAASVLAGAEELFVNFNLKDWHWALMRVMFKFQRVEIYMIPRVIQRRSTAAFCSRASRSLQELTLGVI